MRVIVFVKATGDSEKGILPTPELIAAMGRYNKELMEAGIMRSGDGLKPSSQGKRVAFDGDGRTVVDGPFAATSELVAGFWMWEVEDMDEAVAWVKRCPNPMPRPERDRDSPPVRDGGFRPGVRRLGRLFSLAQARGGLVWGWIDRSTGRLPRDDGPPRGTPLDRGRALVTAAAARVADLQRLLPLFAAGAASGEELCAAVAAARVGSDNLLEAGRPDETPHLLASLERTDAGRRLGAGVLTLDRAATTLRTMDRQGPLDHLLEAHGEAIGPAVRAMRDRLAAAASVLSVAAARLDLQASFVDAVLAEDAVAASPPQATPALDAASVRDAALAVGAMLAKRPISIAAGNRRTLDALFAAMDSGGAAT